MKTFAQIVEYSELPPIQSKTKFTDEQLKLWARYSYGPAGSPALNAALKTIELANPEQLKQLYKAKRANLLVAHSAAQRYKALTGVQLWWTPPQK